MGSSRRMPRRRLEFERVVRRGSLLVGALLLLFTTVPEVLAQVPVWVGVYSNPPKVAIGADGTVSGLYPELLREIATREGWDLEYVPGTWTESMGRLDRGEIDVMVDVAYTVPRQDLYAFNEETVLVNWGTIYTRPELSVLSLPELEGLRVAVMRGSTHTVDPGGIRDLTERFGIRCIFLELDSYTDVFEALLSGAADAGVVNRVFGLTFEGAYGVLRTPIVFNPIELRFALPPAGELTPTLIRGIDRALLDLKADHASAYYRLLEEHLLEAPKRETVVEWPAWLLPTLILAGILIAVLVIAFLIVRREVRERTKAREELRESQERFELAMRGASDGLWDWDLTTGEVYYSPRWALMLGLDPAKVVPTIETFRELVHPEDLDDVLEAEAEYLRGRSDRYRAEFRMLHRDGVYINVLSRAFLVRDEAGAPARVVGTHVDISERKYVEETLREREAYLRTIIEQMPVDFFAIDEDLCYTMQSPISKRAIGDVVGQRADELKIPDELRKTWLDELRRVFAGETIRGQHDIRMVTGEVRTFLSNVAPVVVAGEIIAAIGTSLDITEEKEAARELEEAKERAEVADRLKSTFLATMSHELRTPLNSIIGFTGILLQNLAGPLNDEQTKQLGMIQASARHLLDLINDVLDISKIEAGELEVTIERFDLPALIMERVEVSRPLAEAKDLDLRVDLGEGVGEIESDRRRLGQIIANLLSNAIKFTESGQVGVRCEATDGQTRIDVEDTGIGIHEEDREKLFTPFQQIDTGLTRQYEGTGLGLSICKRLIDKLGGTIGVESEPGRGSVFSVRLPTRS